MAQLEDLNSSRIATCVFNAFLSYTAITLNIITILALRKTSSLPKPLKTLLLSLVVSDLGVGLLVQPLYVAGLVMTMKTQTETDTLDIIMYALFVTATVLSYASYFGVVALSADRFLAIHLHLRYKELVTHKRVVGVVISTWVLSAILTLIYNFWYGNDTGIIVVTIAGLCYLTTALFYFKIYSAVRHHNNGELIENAARQRKSLLVHFMHFSCFWHVIYHPLVSGLSVQVPDEIS